MKHFAVLTFAVVAALCFALTQGVSSIYGNKGYHDVELYKEHVIDSSWWRTVKKDVQYPPPGFTNKKIITAIHAIDETGGKNITTGYASLSEGGPGQTHAKVHIKSAFAGSLNFTILFYTKNENLYPTYPSNNLYPKPLILYPNRPYPY